MKQIIYTFCCYVILSNMVYYANAQDKGYFIIKHNYTITINGSSNLHDWDETVQKAYGEGKIIQNANGTFNIDSLSIRLDVHSIDSKEGKTMVDKTCAALKADRYPYIVFSIANPATITGKNENIIKTIGQLTIAGVSRRINIEGKIYTTNPHQFIFEGTLPIKLSDYNIDPPTAMLGLLKVKDLISVHYRTCFEM